MRRVGVRTRRNQGASATPFILSMFGDAVDLWLEDGNVPAGPVATWQDLSGRGRHFSQGTAANQPVKQAGGGVAFDGSNDVLTRSYESWMSMVSTGTGYSQWTVHSRVDTSTFHALGCNRGSVTVWDSYLTAASTAHLQRGGSGAASGTFNTGTVYLTGLTHTAAGALLANRGTTQTTSTSGPVSNPADDGSTAAYIGSRADGVTHTKGNIYMVLCVRRALTTPEITALATYANAKWGAALT